MIDIDDLNGWHHAAHQICVDMVWTFRQGTNSEDIQRWASALRALAERMESRTEKEAADA